MRRQTYKDSSGVLRNKQLVSIDDIVEQYDLIEEEILNYREDFTGDGILNGLIPSNGGGGILNISSGIFYHNNERVGVETVENIDLAGQSNGLYYIYVEAEENIIENSFPQDQHIPTGDKYHRSLNYIPLFTYSTNDSETNKLKVCCVEVSSGNIIDIDDSFRDVLVETIINNSSQDNHSTWSSQRIVEEIINRILEIDEDPIINILNTPPSSPDDGDRYIIGSSPNADWSGHANDIAQWSDDNNSWVIITPQEGTTVYNQSINEYSTFTGSSWVEFSQGLKFDNIPDGGIYKKVRATPADQLNTTGQSNKVLLRTSSGGYNNTIWDLIKSDNIDDSFKKMIIADEYATEITFNGWLGETLITNPDVRYDTSADNVEGRHLYYGRDVLSSISNPLWTSPAISCRPYESLKIRLRGNFSLSGINLGKSIRCMVHAVNSYGNLIDTGTGRYKIIDIPIVDGWIDYEFGFDGSNFVYVNTMRGVKILFFERDDRVLLSDILFLLPQVLRKSKNQMEYDFIARANDSGVWHIYENTDNKLQSVSYNTSSDVLEMNFLAGFLERGKWKIDIQTANGEFANGGQIIFGAINFINSEVYNIKNLQDNTGNSLSIYLYDHTDSKIDFSHTSHPSIYNIIFVKLTRIL